MKRFLAKNAIVSAPIPLELMNYQIVIRGKACVFSPKKRLYLLSDNETAASRAVAESFAVSALADS